MLNEMLETAFVRLKEGYFEDAVELFSDCLQNQPADAAAYQGRALANFQLRNWPAALADFKKALDLNPADPENGIGVGLTLAMLNEIYPAVDALEKVAKEHPDCTRARYQLGMLYYKLGIIKKGHDQMDLALKSRPSLAERRMIEQLKKEQLNLDKKRYYKPDFEELRKQNQASPSVLSQLIDFAKKLFQKR